MENQRIILFMALAIVVLFMWEAWQDKNGPPIQQVVQSPTPREVVTPASDTVSNTTPQETAIIKSEDAPKVEVSTAAPKIGTVSSVKDSKRIRVITDVLDIDLDSVGGDLRRAFLLDYPISLEKPDEAFPFMDDNLPRLFIAQSGLLSNTVAPDHHANYTFEKDNYRLDPGTDELRVPFTWTSDDGKISVRKTYIFKRNNYLVDVIHEITNNSDQEWRGRYYQQLQRTEYDEPGKSRLLYTFTGAAISTPLEQYEKIEFSEMAEWKSAQSYTQGGWVGMLQHYFVTAWVPGKDALNHFYTRVVNDTRYIVGMSGEEKAVPAQGTISFSSNLYVGPKDQDRLEEVAEHLKLTVDYGILTFLAQPLFWLLQWLHSFLGNWGVAIILVTVIIKLVFYRLSAASYRSMANMRKLAPKFQMIRDRFGDDRQKMSQAMMELYKKEKVNPMSGCWPMLVQIPVFIALYWMLLESVELRQAPFILWIEDLSTKDPYYILPLLMGASMFVQQKLSHNPGMDPMQQKIMQFLPIIFTFFFMLFPAGLVLYWVVNSILSILQQWYITRQIENADG